MHGKTTPLQLNRDDSVCLHNARDKALQGLLISMVYYSGECARLLLELYCQKDLRISLMHICKTRMPKSLSWIRLAYSEKERRSVSL